MTQAPKNAFDLFPADQFDAWVEGVRSKIIDGLEHQHMPGGSQVRVPELSSKALGAIEAARREEELTRQAIASSSSLNGQLNAGETEGITYEVKQEVITTTTLTEYDEIFADEQGWPSSLVYPAQASGSEADHEEEADQTGYDAEPMPRQEYPADTNDSYPDDQELVSDYGEDAEGEYDEDDRSQEARSDAKEDDSEDDFEILGSDNDMVDNERDELSSDEEEGDELPASQDEQEQEDSLGEDDELDVDDEANGRLDSHQFIDLEEGADRAQEGASHSDNLSANADVDDPADDNRSQDGMGTASAEDEEMDGPGSADEDEVYSIEDSSEEGTRSDGEGGSEFEARVAGERTAQSTEEEEEGADEEEEELEELEGGDDVLSEDASDQEQDRDDSDGGSEDTVDDQEDLQSRHSDQEDRAQREGLAQDLRRPVLPATTESDGVYRGTFEIDGTAQENVRIDEKYALEEDDKDSQQDPEYSADERESIEDIQYADDDNAGTFAQTDRTHTSRDHIPTTEEAYADQIQLEPQTKEEIEDEIRHHDNRDILDDTIMYPPNREEYDLDGEDGSHHIEGVPAGHEDEEVVDETDPKDMEVAAWSNEQPAVLQPLAVEGTRAPEPAPIAHPEDLAPEVHEESSSSADALAPALQRSAADIGTIVERSAKAPSNAIDSGVSTGGNETDNEDNDMQDDTLAKTASIPEEMDELEDASIPASRATSPQRLGAQISSSTLVPIKSIVPTDYRNNVVPGEWNEGMSLRFSQTKDMNPGQTAEAHSQPTKPTELGQSTEREAGHDQETGYMGDDEAPGSLQIQRSPEQSSHAPVNSVDTDAAGFNPELETGAQGRNERDVSLAASRGDQDSLMNAAIPVENAGSDNLPTTNQAFGIESALTDENLALVAVDNVPTATGGDVRDSQVGVDEISAQSVLGINDQPRRAKSLSNEATGTVSPVSPEPTVVRGIASEAQLGESASKAVDINMPDAQEVRELSFADLIQTPVDSPRIEEDMFDVTGVSVPGATEENIASGSVPMDIIESAVRDLPSLPAPSRSPTPEPHLPINRQDPALVMVPAVLQEHSYARVDHHDRVAEANHQIHEAHRQAFASAAGSIDENRSRMPMTNLIEVIETPSAEIVNRMLGMPQEDLADSAAQSEVAQEDTGSEPIEAREADISSDSEESPESEATSDPDDINDSEPRGLTNAEDLAGQEGSRIHLVSVSAFDMLLNGMRDSAIARMAAAEYDNVLPGTSGANQSPEFDQPRIDEVFAPVQDDNNDEVDHQEVASGDEAPDDTVQELGENEPEFMADYDAREQSEAALSQKDDLVDAGDNRDDAMLNTEAEATGARSRSDSSPALAKPEDEDEFTIVVQPRSYNPPIDRTGPASVIHVPTPDNRSAPSDAPQTPPARSRDLDARNPDSTHHHHGVISTALRSTLHESERNLHSESPASHTRSQCHYHKMRFDRGAHSHTMLIPGCSLGPASQRIELDVEDLGRASGEEMRRKQNLLFGENFLGHMKSEEEGTLPADLEHRLSVLVGRELIREGHIYILPLEQGVPHVHVNEEEEEEAEAEAEDGGIASRTRRRTSQTPGPRPVTPVREGDKKRKHRGSSVGRTPGSSSKKRASELLDVQEDVKEEEVEIDEDRASKKRIVEVDGTPKAVNKAEGEQEDEVQLAERDRDDEDGDRMDIDERVERDTELPAPATSKGWFGWLWGKK